jgi:DNA-binding GntR family transcriptional regulator
VEVLGRSAADELTERLVSGIVNGDLKPGERLVEAELAERYSVSRGPVRSAFAILRQLGLVDIPTRRGTVVVELTRAEVWDLWEVRIALECAAVERLARGRDELDMSEIRARLEQMEGVGSSGTSTARAGSSLDFHHSLVAACGNNRLLRAWESHADLIKLAMRIRQDAASPTQDPAMNEHRDLLEALLSKDPAKAVGLMTAHLEVIRDELVQLLENREDTP